jgi:hypothetical protein
MRKAIRFVGSAALLAACVSCGDVVRQSRSPVLLVVTAVGDVSGKTPITSDVKSQSSDVATASVQAAMKDYLVSPTPNNAVTLSRYHVQFQRSDGHNTEGVDVPYSFDGAVTATVQPTAGTLAITTPVIVDIVRQSAKLEPPLVQIAAGAAPLATLATVTFYGQDLVGNEMSASGTVAVNFAKLQ